MEKSHRREFLRKSIMGLAGAAILPDAVRPSFSNNPGQVAGSNLQYRMLGRTGIKTPLISLGAGNANDPNFVKASYHAGIKLFFSATYYGEGRNEILTGEGLKGLPRDSFVVGTAVTPDGFDTNNGKFTSPLDVNAYMKKAEESLKRFGLGYIDILLFPYAGKKEVMLDPSLLKAMVQLKKQGKTKFLGVSTHDNMPEALRNAADSRVYDIVMTAYNYKVDKRDECDEAISYAVKAGIGVLAMKTLAGVYEDKSRKKPVDSDAALKWVLQNENISSIVSGMSSLEELNKNMAMIRNITLSEEELKELAISGLMNGQGLYCQQCRQCIPQCSGHLAIPTIMRSYMYAYGYKNMEQARHTLDVSRISGDPCAVCGVCNIECTAGFNVKERIRDIARLKNVPVEFLAT